MVSDSDVIERIHRFLGEADLSTTTNSIIRQNLEETFGESFSDRKTFIREQVDLFLQRKLASAVAPVVDVKVKIEDEGEGVSNEKVKSPEKPGFGPTAVDGANGQEKDEEEEKKPKDVSNGDKERPKKEDVEGKKIGGGFTKLWSLSPQLQEFTGSPEMARTEVVKKLWAYIKENDLQEPSNRRNIICDEKLHSLFGISSIDMFKMNKVLSEHIWPLGSKCGGLHAASSTKSPLWKREMKRRRRERERMKGDDGPKKKKKKKKKKQEANEQSSGHLAPIPLSRALLNFLGLNEESRMARSNVMTKIWEYIKTNHLQDPSDREVVRSDGKLKALFEVDSFNGSSLAMMLSPHFVKEDGLWMKEDLVKGEDSVKREGAVNEEDFVRKEDTVKEESFVKKEDSVMEEELTKKEDTVEDGSLVKGEDCVKKEDTAKGESMNKEDTVNGEDDVKEE